MSRLIYVFTLLILGSHLTIGAEFEIAVEGGEEDARKVVVRVPMDAGDIDSPHFAISGEGLNLIGQITAPSVLSKDGKPQLQFVIPYLASGETLKLYAKSISNEQVSHGYSFNDHAGKYNELSVGGRPVLRYMYEALDRSSKERIGETYKVYHHVYDPRGTRYVTKGAGGKFPHHRGLFFGFNRIRYSGDRQADIWHCKNGEHQAHKEFVGEDMGGVLGRHQLAVDWHGQANDVFAKEARELTAYNTENGTLIEFATVLSSEVAKIRLDGDPQHAGFQFRGSQDIPDKTADKTYYVRPDGKGEPGKFRNWDVKATDKVSLNHINLPWLAISFVLDDKRYTCCYLDHPGNPKPARFSERDYGRFGSYFEYDLTKDKPLKLNYRIWLQEGEMSVEDVDKISNAFVSPPKVTISKH